jgi:hypothetical protein
MQKLFPKMFGLDRFHCIYKYWEPLGLFFSFKPRPELVGTLAPNTYLQKSEKLYENKILGPESIVVDGGKYT